jgi:DNA helicase-2/ATP-dependent DNA helicase PcrA
VLSWARARTPGGRGNRRPSRFLDALLPAEARTASDRPKPRRAAHCRECGRPLSSAAEKKRQRCSDCPASYDEELFERLRAWRKERADEESVPAFVVFTDATLQLIAEQRPSSRAALLRISGVGPAKLERYAESLLEVVG